jgi:signal transduction histidine kinase
VKLSKWLGQAIAEGRSALEAMRSSTIEDSRSLIESLRLATEDLAAPSGMAVEFSVTGEYRDLHPIVQDELWQIGFEAIRNAVQHSQGTQLQVILRYSSDFVLRVKDDGVGMTARLAVMGRAGHFGLTGMRERSYRVRGGFTIDSDPHLGTEVSITVPGAVAYQAMRAHSRLAALKQLFSFSRRRPRACFINTV